MSECPCQFDCRSVHNTILGETVGKWAGQWSGRSGDHCIPGMVLEIGIGKLEMDQPDYLCYWQELLVDLFVKVAPLIACQDYRLAAWRQTA